MTAQSFDEIFAHENTTQRIFLEVFTVVGLISATANVLLILVALKYKRMRKDPSNVIFLQTNVSQAVCLLTWPVTLRLESLGLFAKSPPKYQRNVCDSYDQYIYEVEVNILFGAMCFMMLLLLQWNLKLYHQDAYARFSRIYKYLIAFLYFLVVSGSVLTICFCNIHALLVMLVFLCMLACVFLCTVVLIFINIIHAVKKRKLDEKSKKRNYELAVVNIFFLMWSPSLVGFYYGGEDFEYFMCLLGFSSPVLIFLYLFVYDDDYNTCLKQLFRCDKYENANVENEKVCYNNARGVIISDNKIYSV